MTRLWWGSIHAADKGTRSNLIALHYIAFKSRFMIQINPGFALEALQDNHLSASTISWLLSRLGTFSFKFQNDSHVQRDPDFVRGRRNDRCQVGNTFMELASKISVLRIEIGAVGCSTMILAFLCFCTFSIVNDHEKPSISGIPMQYAIVMSVLQ